MEKFHIEVINCVIKPLLLNLVIVNDSFEFKWQKVNGNLLWGESFQVILPAKQAVRCHYVHTAHGTTTTVRKFGHLTIERSHVSKVSTSQIFQPGENRPVLCEHVPFVLRIERFSCELEMKTRERNRNNKRKDLERFDWFVERLQMRVDFGWFIERSGRKNSKLIIPYLFLLQKPILQNFLFEVFRNYNATPFHNFRHAFCVTQMVRKRRHNSLVCHFLILQCDHFSWHFFRDLWL